MLIYSERLPSTDATNWQIQTRSFGAVNMFLKLLFPLCQCHQFHQSELDKFILPSKSLFKIGLWLPKEDSISYISFTHSGTYTINPLKSIWCIYSKTWLEWPLSTATPSPMTCLESSKAFSSYLILSRVTN